MREEVAVLIKRNAVRLKTKFSAWWMKSRKENSPAMAEYNGLMRDQRKRGMGGRLTSCREENLLKLNDDKYFGRYICVHESAHAIRNSGMDDKTQALFDLQYQYSLEKGV